MPENTKTKLLVGAVVVVGVIVVGYLVYDAVTQDTEDRPPIVVSEGSLDIANTRKGNVQARPWGRDGAGEKWKMKQPKGKNATGFDVAAKNTSTSASCNPGSGSEVWITYASGAGKYRFRFYLDPHPGGKKMEPAVEPENSTLKLGPGNSTADRQVIRYPAAGEIVGVEVSGSTSTPCTFTDAEPVEVTLTIRY